MTPEAINIAISKYMSEIRGGAKLQYHKPTPEELASGSYYQYEPDYLSDLNAMHEAEKTLSGPKVEFYGSWLDRFSDEFEGYSWHATAAQRSEAFLRTIGKWVEA